MKKYKIIKQRSLFKNDSFGIKQKLFVWRNIKRLKRINHLQAKQLEWLLNMTLDIGYPCNEEQEKTLQWVCDKYDALFEEINGRMNCVKRIVGNVTLYNEKEVIEICNKYGIETVEKKEYPLYQGKEMDKKFSIAAIMHEPIPITEE